MGKHFLLAVAVMVAGCEGPLRNTASVLSPTPTYNGPESFDELFTARGKSLDYWLNQLEAPGPTARAEAADALGEISPTQASTTVRALARVLKDSDPDVRRNAACSLGKFAPALAAEAALPALLDLLADERSDVTLAARNAANQLDPSGDLRKIYAEFPVGMPLADAYALLKKQGFDCTYQIDHEVNQAYLHADKSVAAGFSVNWRTQVFVYFKDEKVTKVRVCRAGIGL
jgi:hypothetical protein